MAAAAAVAAEPRQQPTSDTTLSACAADETFLSSPPLSLSLSLFILHSQLLSQLLITDSVRTSVSVFSSDVSRPPSTIILYCRVKKSTPEPGRDPRHVGALSTRRRLSNVIGEISSVGAPGPLFTHQRYLAPRPELIGSNQEKHFLSDLWTIITMIHSGMELEEANQRLVAGNVH